MLMSTEPAPLPLHACSHGQRLHEVPQACSLSLTTHFACLQLKLVLTHAATEAISTWTKS